MAAAARSAPPPAQTRAALQEIAQWLRDDRLPAPPRSLVAQAVRLTARTLAAAAPGAAVEVRIPPFVAVQCLTGARHTRGTPPNVVETDPRTWLLLVAGLLDARDAAAAGQLRMSGSRAADITEWLPLMKLHPDTS